MTKTYGRFGVQAGATCSNSPGIETFTTPCCYADLDGEANECPDCGASIKCEYETTQIAVCTICEEEA